MSFPSKLQVVCFILFTEKCVTSAKDLQRDRQSEVEGVEKTAESPQEQQQMHDSIVQEMLKVTRI